MIWGARGGVGGWVGGVLGIEWGSRTAGGLLIRSDLQTSKFQGAEAPPPWRRG